MANASLRVDAGSSPAQRLAQKNNLSVGEFCYSVRSNFCAA